MVGDLELPFESTPLPLDAGQHLVIYSPEPSSDSYAALQILASWSATQPADESHAPQSGAAHAATRHERAITSALVVRVRGLVRCP